MCQVAPFKFWVIIYYQGKRISVSPYAIVAVQPSPAIVGMMGCEYLKSGAYES